MSNGTENLIKDKCRRTRKKYSAEEKVQVILEGLHGEDSIAELCRREGDINELTGKNYSWRTTEKD